MMNYQDIKFKQISNFNKIFVEASDVLSIGVQFYSHRLITEMIEKLQTYLLCEELMGDCKESLIKLFVLVCSFIYM